MFDYDGTLTMRSEFVPSDELVAVLNDLAENGVPIAVCTGRQLESFQRRFGPHVEQLSHKARENFYFFGENGAIGYKYDASAGGEGEWSFKEIYRGEWPSEIPKEKFREDLLAATAHISEPVEGHEIPFVLRPINALEIPIEDVHRISDDIFEALDKFIPAYEVKDPENGEVYRASDYLHYGNSGLGCIVGPASADKDGAIKAFYEYLRDVGGEGGVEFEEDDGRCREILVVGDNPCVRGNDHFFLNGTYGTSFTVGLEDDDLEGEVPGKVFDKNGQRLFHGEGTLYLLKELQKNL